MRARGFTLLELMVVILIIAVLSAIVIPILRTQREAARRTACANQLNSLAKAIFMYGDPVGQGMPPTVGTPNDAFACPQSLQALNLLYKGYVQDPRIFSCPSRPIPAERLRQITPTVNCFLPPQGTFLNADNCSYGYDPGHSHNDAPAAMLADKKGAQQNSDNHGPNAGQNVVTVGGTVEFRDNTKNPLGIDDSGKSLVDDDIFSRNTSLPRELDGCIRQ